MTRVVRELVKRVARSLAGLPRCPHYIRYCLLFGSRYQLSHPHPDPTKPQSTLCHMGLGTSNGLLMYTCSCTVQLAMTGP